MKITLNIEVSNAEELGEISKALKGINSQEVDVVKESSEVEAEEVEEVEEVAPAKKTAKKASKKASKKAEAAPVETLSETNWQAETKPEDMVEEPSPFVATPSLVDTQPIPDVINAAPITQAAPAIQAAPTFDSVAKIQECATRLQNMGLTQEVSTAVIMKARNAVGAPQGIAGKDLPEPMRTNLAIVLEREINALQVSV